MTNKMEQMGLVSSELGLLVVEEQRKRQSKIVTEKPQQMMILSTKLFCDQMCSHILKLCLSFPPAGRVRSFPLLPVKTDSRTIGYSCSRENLLLHSEHVRDAKQEHLMSFSSLFYICSWLLIDKLD